MTHTKQGSTLLFTFKMVQKINLPEVNIDPYTNSFTSGYQITATLIVMHCFVLLSNNAKMEFCTHPLTPARSHAECVQKWRFVMALDGTEGTFWC